MPDIDNSHLAASVQHLVDNPIITDPDPVKILCAGKFVCIVRTWLICQVLNMVKNGGKDLFGNFPEIFFSALFKTERLGLHIPGSHHTLFELGQAYRSFVPPLGNHGKIMKIFLEVLVFRERKDDGNFVTILIDNILFNSTHTEFLGIPCIHLMIKSLFRAGTSRPGEVEQ